MMLVFSTDKPTTKGYYQAFNGWVFLYLAHEYLIMSNDELEIREYHSYILS